MYFLMDHYMNQIKLGQIVSGVFSFWGFIIYISNTWTTSLIEGNTLRMSIRKEDSGVSSSPSVSPDMRNSLLWNEFRHPKSFPLENWAFILMNISSWQFEDESVERAHFDWISVFCFSFMPCKIYFTLICLPYKISQVFSRDHYVGDSEVCGEGSLWGLAPIQSQQV